MSYLQQAEMLVSGQRADDYGPVAENFARIARLWSAVLGVKVTAADVALCMIQVKVARLVASPGHVDSWVDIAGYVGCAEHVTAAVTGKAVD